MSAESDDAPIPLSVEHSIAAFHLKGVQTYAERGRPLRSLSLDELFAEFSASHADWALDLGNQAAIGATTDVTSEYELRGLQPPHGDIPDTMAVITAKAYQQIDAMSEEDALRILSGMERRYAREKGGGN